MDAGREVTVLADAVALISLVAWLCGACCKAGAVSIMSIASEAVSIAAELDIVEEFGWL